MGDPAKEETTPAPFTHNGLLVSPQENATGEVLYAEIEPAYSRWLPWPGRTSRWWYEVHSVHEPDEHRVDRTTYAYQAGGSGGGFTLASCVRRASRAVAALCEPSGGG